MWSDLAAALCLVLVIEGLLPFAAPQVWRGLMFKVVQSDDAALRTSGLISMLLGAGLLFLVR